MSGHAQIRSALALSVLAFLASCTEVPPPRTTGPATAPTPMPYTWHGDGATGQARIVVSIGEQRAYFFKGKTLVGESSVSTGKAGFSTPPGQYRVVWKNKDHISTRFGNYVDELGNVVVSNVDSRKDRRPPGARFDGARMPYAMFFKGGYAMHQGYVPPYAASHGCIRLPPVIAELFFNAAPLGTPVHVKQGPVAHTSPPIPVQPPPLGPAADFAAAPRTQPPVPVRVPAPTPAANLAPAPRTRPLSSVPVRSTSPAPVRPTYLRSNTPAPASVRAPAPVPVRSPSPAPVRPTAVRSTVPGPASVPPSAPGPVRSPAPVRSTAPASVRPTPIPALSPTPGPGRSRVPVRRPAPSPTPTPARR